VNKPGSVVLPGETKLTILDAIGRAGGLTVRGNPNKIKFIRPGKPAQMLKFEDLQKQSDSEKIFLEPGDVIDVADRTF
jgi:protein involved in polysaccharide export with SLBB domain